MDTHWDRIPPPRLAPVVEPRSLYLTMRDGTRIAIDVYEPSGPRAPAIVRQTRYLRSLSLRVQALRTAFDLYARTRRAFLGAGYAWVDVDVRGTGASTGSWPCPWSRDEVLDGAEVVDWIVRQPWSNGLVGSLGISYDGTAAEMLATAEHRAVRAVAPMFSLYDVYTDVAFPGGIQLTWFTERWSRYNAALDRNAYHEAMAGSLHLIGRAGVASPARRGLERLFAPLAREGWDGVLAPILAAGVRGVRPVDNDRALLQQAIREHAANVDIHAGALAIAHRDQRGLSPVMPEETIDYFSPHHYREQAIASGTAMYSMSGWRDGAYQRSAITRFNEVRTPGSRLLLGPWVHSGRLRIVPFGVAQPTGFDFDAELVAFFDEHLWERPRPDVAVPVRWYTMVEERWKSGTSWPPPARETSFHLASERRLLAEAPRDEAASDVFHESGESGTGERSRWRSLISLVPGDYPDRRARDERLVYWETPPLERALEVTGEPSVVLHMSWDDASDGHVFAYLEDVAPDGRVAYVTEGELRALYRDTPRTFMQANARPLRAGAIEEIAFSLLPVSWLFERGHRIRLALAGADRDHFAVLAPRTFRVHRTRAHPSRLVVPAIG